MLDTEFLQRPPDLRQNRLRHLAPCLGGEEIVAATVAVERAEQAVTFNHFAQAAEARRRALLGHQESRIDPAGGVLHRHHQIILARVPGQPGMRRSVLVQHHPHHWPPRPLLAMRRAFLGLLNQPLSVQMQLGHRIAQDVIVPFDQLLVEMLDREAAVNVAIQSKHPLNLRHRRPAQRRSQPPIGQAWQSNLPVAITPATERPLADPKQLRRLDLAQLRAFGSAKNICEAHSAYPLVNACPIHPIPPSQEVQMTGHFTSYKTRTEHELTTPLVIDIAAQAPAMARYAQGR
jgi:hypothetical protein